MMNRRDWFHRGSEYK